MSILARSPLTPLWMCYLVGIRRNAVGQPTASGSDLYETLGLLIPAYRGLSQANGCDGKQEIPPAADRRRLASGRGPRIKIEHPVQAQSGALGAVPQLSFWSRTSHTRNIAWGLMPTSHGDSLLNPVNKGREREA
ncbi:hypothetical protein GGS23DRAFT_248155 [Durotheca rogersii]|uniref:uncharacterized protein n=1 Tax=Durotheca rogersii TaxID=419775 RepID=UPI0022206BDB|nr:uncharacterized protein GGS23DRAFT_248155 [Durotheca rogersii]KAI5860082.1 hypothetical protein GGS23DRAFT_248155 [Durotheca rogersii]